METSRKECSLLGKVLTVKSNSKIVMGREDS